MPHPRVRALVILAVLVGVVSILDLGSARLLSQQTPRGGPAQTLTPEDVAAIINAAASAISDSGMAVAVVDRAGTILGVYGRGAAPATPDIAVSLARTTAYFSNDQAPLSSRTVRFISGIHFPAGIKNAGNAALYGVENINRGCALDADDALYRLAPPFIDRARSLAGTPGATGGVTPVACRPSDTRGCAAGGAILGLDGRPISSTGITTGKRDLLDSNNGSEDAINPGGISIYRAGHLIGGVGVAGVPFDRAAFAALVGAAGTRSTRGITAAINFPSLLPTPGAIYIDGIRLPFYESCGTDIACIDAASRGRPAGSSPGSFAPGGYLVAPGQLGRQAPEGYLVGPRSFGGSLTTADVQRIVSQAVAEADTLRAAVRLPFGQTSTFIIAVTDENGNILAEYRMVDALFDAVDVVPAKARNAFYFSTREGYEVLKSFVTGNRYDRYTWEPDPPSGQGWALTSRTISFGGQPLFPPGIDLEKRPTPGPWFDLFVYDTLNPCTEGPGPSRGGSPNRSFPNQNGITWFPGSSPLYKNGRLVGGLGVSGDGVEQNDLVSAAGAVGFEPPPELRVDNSVIRTGAGEDVRLPYLKFPRNATQR